MREMKFRVWDRKHNRMSQPFRLGKDPNIVFNSKCICGVEITGNDFIYLQFTGLKDKNGVEIYEGDIVTGWFKKQKIVGQIFYGSNAAFFIQRKDLLGISLINANVWVEVIGNIYETPELLNVY